MLHNFNSFFEIKENVFAEFLIFVKQIDSNLR